MIGYIPLGKNNSGPQILVDSNERVYHTFQQTFMNSVPYWELMVILTSNTLSSL